jgi:hypothetical protein
MLLNVLRHTSVTGLRYVFKPLKIKTKYKNPSHVGLEIKTKNKKPNLPCPFFEIHCLRTRTFF